MSHPEGPEHQEEHLPEPSVWPLLAGAAALFIGMTLIFWTRDRASSISGPLFGAAGLLMLVVVAGWATEDSRMRRRAERRDVTTPREARYTQVVTFAIAAGQLERANSDSGVLTAINDTDSSLHALAGFQDLRIILSPAETGPTQVLVETTWSDREGLASYEETRQTLLDLVNAHTDEIAEGSIQVFDMQVVRDTKEVGFRFALGPAMTILGAFIVGGFMIGAGLTVFQKSTNAVAAPSTAVAGPTDAPGTTSVTATDNKFDKTALSATVGQELTVNFKNAGKVPHNIHFFDKKGGTSIALVDITSGGGSATVKFTPSTAGTYYFQCDVHPDQMFGNLTVK